MITSFERAPLSEFGDTGQVETRVHLKQMIDWETMETRLEFISSVRPILSIDALSLSLSTFNRRNLQGKLLKKYTDSFSIKKIHQTFG